MTAIWQNDGAGWTVLSPAGFPDEDTLHSLIEEAPQLLPLSGDPKVVILGREVRCGPGAADLVGVEPGGRLVIIEVKLGTNPEARRAVVAQLLSYAAFLKGLTLDQLDQKLGPNLAHRSHESVLEAVQNSVQSDFDGDSFKDALADSLRRGAFRLVFLLDDVPADLVQVVGYLEAISEDRVVIDLITVAKYQVGGSTLYVPQRVDAEPIATDIGVAKPVSPGATTVKGPQDFIAAIPEAPVAVQENLRRLANWAIELERKGCAELFTSHGLTRKTLPVGVKGRGTGLVTISTDTGGCLWLYRSVFDRLAPKSLVTVETLLAPDTVGQGTSVKGAKLTDELLAAIATAYEEAFYRKLV